MKLLMATPSPFARKVRVALHEKSLPFEEIIDNPWKLGALASMDNPLGKIPVLETTEGANIYDSRVIVDYLETLGAEPALVPTNATDRIAVRQIEALADGICDAVVLIVLERARVPERQSSDWIARQMVKIERGIAELSTLLDERQLFVGERLTLADIASGCALGYLDLRLPEFDWRHGQTDLSRFAAVMERRRSFKKTRPEVQSIEGVS
jgi:glutathione S-transferase